MIANSTTETHSLLCQRIQSSIARVAEIRGFSCLMEDDKLVIRGQVSTRDEAMMCAVVARLIPGVGTFVNNIRVVS